MKSIALATDYNKLERQWGTYYGGNDEETGKSKGFEIDSDGSVIVAGGTKSNNSSNKIASPNAFQTVLNGARDMFLVKFNKDGSRAWSTYFGGNQWDFARDICLDKEGNIYVTGFTGSTTVIGMPTSHQKNHGGGDDAFIAKFDRNGNRIWSTYFGGSENEHIHSIEYDGKGSIYTCGRTLSPNNNNAIATQGAYQTSLAGGADGYLAKFDTNGKRIWSTYIGGEILDASKAITFLPNGNVVLVGATESKNFKVSPNAYQMNLAGKNDCFLAIFSPNGEMIKSTYFGGTGEDHPQAVTVSEDGLIIVAGETESNGLGKGNVHQNSKRGDFDGFISVFDSDLQLLYSTYFGGEMYDNILDVHYNHNNEIVVCGATESSNFISTNYSYQKVKNNGQDGYFAIFNKSLKLLYSSYYGAPSDDIILGIRQKGDTIAFAGMTNSNSPAVFCTNNCFQKVYSGSTDIFIASFALPLSLAQPQILVPENNKKLSRYRVEFRWSSVDNALNYNLIVKDMSQSEIVNKLTKDTFLIIDSFRTSDTYLCKVKAIAGNIESEFSDEVYFTIAKNKPQKIKLIYPKNDTLNMPLKIDLVWENDENSEWYLLTVLDSNNIIFFKDSHIEKNIGNTTTYTIIALNTNCKYNWFVIGSNTDSTGDSSDIWHFTTLGPMEISFENIETKPYIHKTDEEISWYFPAKNCYLEIYDYIGRLIFESKESLGVFYFKHLQSGIYFIRYFFNNTLEIKKFIN